MPGFIKTEQDEKKWKKAKKIVKDQKNKNYPEFTDQDWGLTTHIWKNMNKKTKAHILSEMEIGATLTVSDIPARDSDLMFVKEQPLLDEEDKEDSVRVPWVNFRKDLMELPGRP